MSVYMEILLSYECYIRFLRAFDIISRKFISFDSFTLLIIKTMDNTGFEEI